MIFGGIDDDDSATDWTPLVHAIWISLLALFAIWLAFVFVGKLEPSGLEWGLFALGIVALAVLYYTCEWR